jgi:hypothetical protein
MPKELDVQAPNRDLALSNKLMEKYGHSDWYSWRLEHWGTKWGCYDAENSSRGLYVYTTAWSTVDDSIIKMLLKDIPTFIYQWEEEQGFGEEMEYENGEQTYHLSWDLPNWDETDNEDIQFLTSDHRNGEGFFKKGYYTWGLSEYLGETYEEALEELSI